MSPTSKKVRALQIVICIIVALVTALLRANVDNQIAIRTADYGSGFDSLEISPNSHAILMRAVNNLAFIDPVTAVGAEIAYISDPDSARIYTDSLYKYSDEIQTEFAVSVSTIIENTKDKLAKVCNNPTPIKDFIYGKCGEIQVEAVKNFRKFKREFIKKTRKETLSDVYDQIEFLSIAPKIARINNANAEKIAARFIRNKRISEEGCLSVYSEDVGSVAIYIAYSFNYYVKVLIAMMMAYFISYNMTPIRPVKEGTLLTEDFTKRVNNCLDTLRF